VGECVATFSPLDQISALITVVTTLETMFEKYIKADGIILPLQASMSVAAFTSAIVGSRVVWRYEHPGEQFDRTDELHLLQLKMIYQNNRWDWTKDPLFKEHDALCM
jgi:hypothetical protein